MGIDTGISKSEVSRVCARLDERVGAFRNRTLGHVEFPYVYLDATYVHVRDDALGQVVSRAVVVATGITAAGGREVLGVDVGDSEDETFWTAFLRSLKARGLGGVRLVISDAHAGLTAAIRKCMTGASWQRCRVHYARNLLACVPKGSQEMVAAAFRSIFAQHQGRVEARWDEVTDTLDRFPKAAESMRRPAPTCWRSTFPRAHWRSGRTTRSERLNKEIKRLERRWDLPNDPAVIRLIGGCSPINTTSGPSPAATSEHSMATSTDRDTDAAQLEQPD